MKKVNPKRSIFSIFFATAIFLVSITSCNKTRYGGDMVVNMTDDPADFTEVNVELKEVMVHYSDVDEGNDGWITLSTNAGMYDLLELQNDVFTDIAHDEDLPLGNVTQVRLILGDNNYVVDAGEERPLLLSSQDETGLKINLNTELRRNRRAVILLDFDAEKSIVETGNGNLKLKPVISVEDIKYIRK